MKVHILTPRDDGPFLSPEAIVAKLIREFDFVTVSGLRGREATMPAIDEMRAAGMPGDEIEEYDKRTKGAYRAVARDHENEKLARLDVILVPEEHISVGYESDEHFLAAQPLVWRLAKTLGYEVIEVPEPA